MTKESTLRGRAHLSFQTERRFWFHTQENEFGTFSFLWFAIFMQYVIFLRHYLLILFEKVWKVTNILISLRRSSYKPIGGNMANSKKTTQKKKGSQGFACIPMTNDHSVRHLFSAHQVHYLSCQINVYPQELFSCHCWTGCISVLPDVSTWCFSFISTCET